MIRPIIFTACCYFFASLAIQAQGQVRCLEGEVIGDGTTFVGVGDNTSLPVIEIVNCRGQVLLSSAGEPTEWGSVECFELNLQVFIPKSESTIERLEFLLDGRDITSEECDSPSPSVVKLPSLTPGRHTLQARCLMSDGEWTQWSNELRFTVPLPVTPSILSVANWQDSFKLAATSDLIKITAPTIRINVAGRLPGYSIVAYIDDEEVPCSLSNGSLCLDLQKHYPSGLYSLTIRNVQNSSDDGVCILASEPSPPLQILYQPSKGIVPCRISPCADSNSLKVPTSSQPVAKMLPFESSKTKTETPQVSTGNQETKPFFVGNDQPKQVEELPPQNTPIRTPYAKWPTQACKLVPGVLPFRTLASATPIDQTTSEDSCHSDKTEQCPPNFTHGVLFSEPASFPLRGYGQRGETFNREGLVIYEGMQLAFNKATGNYEVSFVAEIPAQPVDLRLQFIVDKGGSVQTITLPPIRITADQIKENRDSSSWIIRHSGNSPALRCDCVTAIRRTGTVRFGYGTTLDESDKTGF